MTLNTCYCDTELCNLECNCDECSGGGAAAAGGPTASLFLALAMSTPLLALLPAVL